MSGEILPIDLAPAVSLPEDPESKFVEAYGDYETWSAQAGTYKYCTAFE